MNRQEKDRAVEEIRELLGGAQAVILTQYSGLNVASMVKLRAELRQVNAGFRVMKNTLARLATADTDFSGLHPHLKGPTGVVYTHEDPAAAAKVVTAFAKDHPALLVSVGCLDGGDMLDAAGIEALSKLPGKDQLRGQLLSVFNAASTQFVRVLSAPVRDIVGVIAARGRALDGE